MLFVYLLGCDSEEPEGEPVCPSETGGDPGAFRVDVTTYGNVGGGAVINQLEVFDDYDSLNAWWTNARSDDVAEMDFTDAQAVGMVTWEWSDATPWRGDRIDSFAWSDGDTPPILVRMARECAENSLDYTALWEVWSTPVADVETCTLPPECDTGGDAD